MGFLKAVGRAFGIAADTTYSVASSAGLTVSQALQQWIKEHPEDAELLNRNGQSPDVTVLTEDKYRSIRFDEGMPKGQSEAKVFDGKFYYTVGEYNDAVNKAYGPTGKYYPGHQH